MNWFVLVLVVLLVLENVQRGWVVEDEDEDEEEDEWPGSRRASRCGLAACRLELPWGWVEAGTGRETGSVYYNENDAFIIAISFPRNTGRDRPIVSRAGDVFVRVRRGLAGLSILLCSRCVAEISHARSAGRPSVVHLWPGASRAAQLFDLRIRRASRPRHGRVDRGALGPHTIGPARLRGDRRNLLERGGEDRSLRHPDRRHHRLRVAGDARLRVADPVCWLRDHRRVRAADFSSSARAGALRLPVVFAGGVVLVSVDL